MCMYSSFRISPLSIQCTGILFFFFLWWWYLTSLGFVKKNCTFSVVITKIKKICTLFPRHLMIPQPTQEMLVLRIYLQRSPRTQTDTSIPTICLLMMHWKSCTKFEVASLTGCTFCLSPPLGSCSFGELERDLLSVALIREFHFIVTLLFSGPRIFLALRGTISWKLYPFIIHEISVFFFTFMGIIARLLCMLGNRALLNLI